MSSPNMLHPQDGYFPPAPPDARRRSSSYTDRYRPRAYSNPPPSQADQAYLHPAQAPLPMSGQSTPLYAPPYPVEHSYRPGVDMPLVPARQLADEIPMRRSSEVVYPDGLRRPSYDAAQVRRMSHDSRMSHRSERSHHSHHSHHSHRSRQDYDDEDDEEEDRHKHHHHKHEDIEEYRKRQKEKGNDVSRSFGGSLLSVLSPLKYLLEPRDKY